MVLSGKGAKVAAVTVLLLMVIPAATASGPRGSVVGMEPGVVDGLLQEVLANAQDGEGLEVIVQFRDDVLPQDLDAVDGLGLEVLHRYTIIPALWLRGGPLAIQALSSNDRVVWMEHNEELEYLMDETTEVIGATLAWTSRVEGSLWGASGIDGTGVAVVVVDSGIDAGHPDLDYGTKTIRNLKSDTGTGPWYEIENGDTSSGHGTHVAGTVAGNGDASAGSRAGVAPGAKLIGLSVGEAVFVTGGLGGLEWAYENSRPGNNPYNIKVVTNSWGGGGGQYDPQDSISQAINNLVYDNNVVVTFAAGNSGGDGNTIEASNYGNTPAAVCVAASGRDGSYITDFSSKGQWDWVDTWPDIAAPGHNIESTAARRTLISIISKGGDANPYYLAISGTSMATPHVAGAAALLFQAAPSLRVSDIVEDVGLVKLEDGTYTVAPPEEGTYGDLAYTYDEWMDAAPDTRIHEVELILKLTADYIPPEGEGSPDANGLTDNYVPDWSVQGIAGGREHDFSQGYGLINLSRAVGLAITVERLRWDHPDATVLDAYGVYEDVIEEKEVSIATDTLTTHWGGEWSRFTESPLKPAVYVSNLTKFLRVPSGAGQVTVTMTYSPVDTTELVAGSLGFRIDYGNDGSWDLDSGVGPNLDGTRTETITLSGDDGKVWRFEVYGVGFRFQRPFQANFQYQEARMEVEMTVGIRFPSGEGDIYVEQPDLHAINAYLRPVEPSSEYSAGNVTMLKHVYNLGNIKWSPPVEPEEPALSGGGSWLWLLVVLLFLLVAAYIIARFFPDTPAGRLVLRVATAVGIVAVWRWVRGTGARAFSRARRHLPVGRGRVIKAELVEETKGPSE